MFKKLFSVIITVVMLTSFLVTPAISSAASKEGEETIKGYSKEETLEMIRFIEEEAIEVDENGNAKVNLEKIKDRFGYIPQEYIDFNKENKNINECTTNPINNSIIMRAKIGPTDYQKCVMKEIKGSWKDALGVSALQSAIEALDAGRKWAAAKHIIKAGAKGGIHGIVLTLGWIQVKCIGA